MGILGVATAFIGYVLCYASVANHGKFALSPWEGVFDDAYDAGASTAATVTPPPRATRTRGRQPSNPEGKTT